MLLIYPPVAKPCEPPAGIARLAGVLRENNIACSLVDMNMECLYYLLNQPQNPEDTWGRRAYKNVAANLEVMRTAPLYDSLDRYKRAAADLNRVIDTVGKSHGVSISLVNYQDPEISPLISKDLLRCASVPEKNIYYPYFSSRLASLIETQSPKMIGFSINYLSQAASAFSMIGYVKKLYPQLPIVAGGGLITSWMRNDHWENPFEDIVDHLVAGPGEEKLLRLYGVENFSLDSPPSYEGLELSQYLSPGFILPYAASSGCYWNKCAFCPEKAEGNPYMSISPDRVGTEIQHLCSQNNPALIHFLDNAISPALMRYMAANPPGADWYGFARVGRELEDEEFCRDLRKSGCLMLKLGLESGDQNILDKMCKGISLEMVSRALIALRKAGIATYVYILFGTPSESIDEARRTLEFIVRHKDEIGFLNLAVFNMPINSPEAGMMALNSFYEGDLGLYTDFDHPRGWNRQEIRKFLDQEVKRHPAVAEILRRDPPFFTSNHASFFVNTFLK
ncbi:MAG: radical SAM protein [Desulfobulbaceae bacterium]|uniref:Radical SAM protein n=1 Tax=Candidatus Desulfobia pelagia TaxID=2841692 RepID=A0A8J6NDW6_9BACT|nr:radical SAM protein [Candidatus Desulfobia pelagia]